jgi:hypothetical protein
VNGTQAHRGAVAGASIASVREPRYWIENPETSKLIKREGALLFLALFVIGLSVAMPFLQDKGLWLTVPCWFKRVTGLPCLTCGMTRSFSLAAHGQWYEAFRMHLLGPVLFVPTCGALIYLAVSLVGGFRVRLNLSLRARRAVFWSVLGAFTTCWMIKIAFMKGTW